MTFASHFCAYSRACSFSLYANSLSLSTQAKVEELRGLVTDLVAERKNLTARLLQSQSGHFQSESHIAGNVTSLETSTEEFGTASRSSPPADLSGVSLDGKLCRSHCVVCMQAGVCLGVCLSLYIFLGSFWVLCQWRVGWQLSHSTCMLSTCCHSHLILVWYFHCLCYLPSCQLPLLTWWYIKRYTPTFSSQLSFQGYAGCKLALLSLRKYVQFLYMGWC